MAFEQVTKSKIEVEKIKRGLSDALKDLQHRVHRIRVQNWLDNYHGRRPEYVEVRGIEIEDDELYQVIKEALELVEDPTGRGRIRIEKIVATEDDLVIAYQYDCYNQYNRWVGTQYTYTTLSKLLQNLEGKQVNKEKIKEALIRIASKL